MGVTSVYSFDDLFDFSSALPLIRMGCQRMYIGFDNFGRRVGRRIPSWDVGKLGFCRNVDRLYRRLSGCFELRKRQDADSPGYKTLQILRGNLFLCYHFQSVCSFRIRMFDFDPCLGRCRCVGIRGLWRKA